MMNRRMLLSTLGLAAVGGGAWYLSGSSADNVTQLGAVNAQEATGVVDLSGIVEMAIGDENAPVTLIEYASFTCPHCRNFHETVLPTLKSEFIDTGKVRMIYREVYFDRPGLWASMMARCAETPEQYFGITNLIYTKQSEWAAGDGPAIAANLRTIGLSAGLSVEAVEACMTDADTAQNLVAWYNANREADDVSSTPTFLINGEKFDGNWASGLLPALAEATGT